MKKILILLIVLLSYSYSQAQEVKLGVKAGANISNIATESEKYDNKLLFHFGIMANIKLSDKVIIQPELIYSQQGALFEGENFFSQKNFEHDFTLNYLNIPIYLNYEINDSFSINIGPQIGFLLNSKIESFFEVDDISFPSGIVEFLSEDPESYENISFGFNGGLSYLVNDLILSANYNFGITDFNNTDAFNANRVIQVSIGYFFL